MIEMAALIYTRSLRGDTPDGSFVVTMDEPENHLHPAMQRSLLPALMKAFPNVQFIVATHSPFIASSARSAAVYALKYESVAITDEEITTKRPSKDARRVTALRLDENALSANPAEVLREVLGVPVSIPVWAEAGLDRIIEKYRGCPFNEATIAALRQDVEQERLSELFPEALITLGRVND